MNGGPKDNANPIILTVEQSGPCLKRQPLGWAELAAISADSPRDADLWNDEPNRGIERSAEDLAVMHALTDIAAATNGEGVSLLRKVGIVVSDEITSSLQPSIGIDIFVKRTSEPVVVEEEKRRDCLDADEIYEIIRNIQDPEHPLTLEQLGVVSRKQIEVCDALDDNTAKLSYVNVRFTPTVPHCSMATLIGLSIRVKLMRSLPPRFKIKVCIEPGSHQSEKSVNKQLADKERVSAALENPHLRKVVNRCISNGMTGNMS